MNKTLKMPWSIKDTTENLKEVKEILKTYLRRTNYEGKGESDVAEAEIDFNRAIEALEKQIPKPLKELKNPNPIELGNDYAACPNCGEWLGKKKLVKHRCNYCPKCGQALDCEVEE